MRIIDKIFSKNKVVYQLSQADLDWNELMRVLSTLEYGELNDFQRVAYHAWHYDSEVQNGGHLQFYLNSNADELANTESALQVIGADEILKVYKSAYAAFKDAKIKHPKNVKEYLEEIKIGAFEAFDHRYYSGMDDINTRLMRFLEKNKSNLLRSDKS